MIKKEVEQAVEKNWSKLFYTFHELRFSLEELIEEHNGYIGDLDELWSDEVMALQYELDKANETIELISTHARKLEYDNIQFNDIVRGLERDVEKYTTKLLEARTEAMSLATLNNMLEESLTSANKQVQQERVDRKRLTNIIHAWYEDESTQHRHNTKITKLDVEYIKLMKEHGISTVKIGEMFGVSDRTIRYALANKTWK